MEQLIPLLIMMVSLSVFTVKCPKKKKKSKDEIGLRNYIKAIDFQSSVFTQPIKEQANEMTKILQSALKKFVPIKKIIIKP